MSLQVEAIDGVTVVKFQEMSLVEPNVEAAGKELASLLDDGGGHRLCLDFSAVEYISSLGLAKVVALHKRLRAAGGHLTLRNLDPLVYEVFEITHLTKLLDVRRKEAGAA
jgi:anti-anti-sigma factor